jgi:tRNA-splicing ligase RtcB (3'-phosphate/5'-hydroxy nucleic acid ligase)
MKKQRSGCLLGATFVPEGKLGFIPGSVGAASHVVESLGNAGELNSSPNHTGRNFSRAVARRQFSASDLRVAMVRFEYGGADALTNRIPAAYQVVSDAALLVQVRHTL